MTFSRFAGTVLAFSSLGTPLGAATITISGQVYDGNGGPLLKGNVYHALGQVEVPAGQTLSAEEGVIVKFMAGVGMTVNGVLDFEGTDLERIVLTSIHDDNAGGDTNLNGGATTPQPGDWKGLFFSGTSDGSIVTWSDVKWAGTATNSGAFELNNTQVLFDHLRFSDTSWHALNLDESNTNNDATVTNCQFTRCRRPIVGVAADSLKKLLNNSSTDCTQGDYATMINNDDNFHADADLSPANFVNGVQVGGFSIPGGIKVTLRHGVIVKLHAADVLFAGITVVGTLELLGTPGDPVVITSFRDDTHGGDTNDNGSATQPQPGDWFSLATGVTAPFRGTLIAEHAIVRYGGGSGNHLIGLSGRSNAELRDSVFEKGGRHGIYIGSDDPLVVERCAVRDCLGKAYVDGALTLLPAMLDNTASGNAQGDYLRIFSAGNNPPAMLTFGPRNYPGDALVLATSVDILAGKTVEMLPGTVVKHEKQGNIYRWSVGGVLHAKGHADAPIVFTSLNDDSVAGDTDKDGAATPPAAGDWGGVSLLLNSGASEFEHVVLRYGGADQPQLLCNSALAVVRSVSSRFSKLAAIQGQRHAGVARNWLAADNVGVGIDLTFDSFDLVNATAAGNGGAGIRRNSQWTGKLSSSIAWNNVQGNLSGFNGAEVFYCDGGFAGSNGNIDTDPKFVAPSNGDYELQQSSPCVETGDPADKPGGSDLGGNSRFLDGDLNKTLRLDMGAHEFGTAQVAVTGNATPGGTITIATTGTPSTSAFLFVSLTPGDALIPYYGNLLIGFTPIWLLVPWPNVPSSVPAPLPSFLPVPLDLYLQILVTYANSAGSLTNLAVVQVR